MGLYGNLTTAHYYDVLFHMTEKMDVLTYFKGNLSLNHRIESLQQCTAVIISHQTLQKQTWQHAGNLKEKMQKQNAGIQKLLKGAMS